MKIAADIALKKYYLILFIMPVLMKHAINFSA